MHTVLRKQKIPPGEIILENMALIHITRETERGLQALQQSETQEQRKSLPAAAAWNLSNHTVLLSNICTEL